MIRRPVPWPNGAKVAVAITFDMDADSLVHVEHPTNSITRVSTISMLQYGPQVGVPRILEAYRRYGLKQTFFVPAWCIERYPDTVEAIAKDGHEVGFHGYIHEAPNSLSREEEHYWMQRSIAVIEKHTGKRPRGNRSPLYNYSINTTDLLVEEGFLYDSSLMGDDVPYILDNGRARSSNCHPAGRWTTGRPMFIRSTSTTCSRSCLPTARWKHSWPSSKRCGVPAAGCGSASGTHS